MTKTDQHQKAMRHDITLEVERSYTSEHDAMLQSLRLVLGLTKMPITLKNNDGTSKGKLAILPGKSDVCTLTARPPRYSGQEEQNDVGRRKNLKAHCYLRAGIK